jgi:hypothetical protein
MNISEDGPYLSAALLCDRVLLEQDNTPTAIRIIDRAVTNIVTITGSGAPTAAPVEPEPEPFSFTLFISLKSGKARGSSTVKIVLEQPSGIKSRPQELPVLFEGEDRGVNLIVPFKMKPDPEGLYWFHILLEDQLLTRIPLRVIRQRSVISPG